MTKFFFILAWRNIKNNLTHSIVNIVGLSIGICAFIIISLFLQNIYSIDKYNVNHERIFLLQQKIVNPTNGISYTQKSPFPLSETLSSQYPEIENFSRYIYKQEQLQLQGKNKIISEYGIYADPSFSSILTLYALAGDTESALTEPNSIILNESVKLKLFGDTPNKECIGKVINIGEKISCKVTAVIKDSKQTTIWYDFIISMSTFINLNNNNIYDNWEIETRNVILLKKDANYYSLNEKIELFLQNRDKIYENNYLFLLPLTDNFLNNPMDTKRKMIVMMVVILTIFILTISFINFINLRYANAITRIKETSIKKVLGAARYSVIIQWIGESALITFIAFDLSMLLAEFLLPAFNQVVGEDLKLICPENWKLLITLLTITIFIGIISGSIPAIKISSTNIIKSLQNQFKSPKSKLGARKALLIFQISLTVIFISATIIMKKQLNYHVNKDKGFNEKGLLIHRFIASTTNRNQIEKMQEFGDKLKENPNISQTSISSSSPFIDFYDFPSVYKKGAEESEKIPAGVNYVDVNYLKTLGIRLKEGQIFTDEDMQRPVCIINETAQKQLGLNHTLGEIIMPLNIEVIGVVHDYHRGDMNWPILPAILIPRNDTTAYKNNVLIIRTSGQNTAETKDWIVNKTEEYLPDDQVEYTWLEDIVPHEVVKAMNLTFKIFSFIAILLSIIGLFGMISYTTVARSKEIGIRKVVGANTLSIFALLLKSQLRFVIIANIISWPIAYFLMKTFLQFSAYRVNISVFVFIPTSLLTFFIMFLTVGYHILRASRTNPVNELRYE